MVFKNTASILAGWITALYLILLGIFIISGLGLKILSILGITEPDKIDPWTRWIWVIYAVSLITFFIVPFIVGFVYSRSTKELISPQYGRKIANYVAEYIFGIAALLFAIVMVYAIAKTGLFKTDLNKLRDFFSLTATKDEQVIIDSLGKRETRMQPYLFYRLALTLILFAFYWEICFSLFLGSRLYFHKNKS